MRHRVEKYSAELKLRLPEWMRAAIEESAKKNGTSMNSEIMVRLIRSFEVDYSR